MILSDISVVFYFHWCYFVLVSPICSTLNAFSCSVENRDGYWRDFFARTSKLRPTAETSTRRSAEARTKTTSQSRSGRLDSGQERQPPVTSRSRSEATAVASCPSKENAAAAGGGRSNSSLKLIGWSPSSNTFDEKYVNLNFRQGPKHNFFLLYY